MSLEPDGPPEELRFTGPADPHVDPPSGAVTLSPALRALLPFEVDEPVEVGIPFPTDDGICSLALTLDVGQLPVGDTLGLVHASGKSGLLLFSHRGDAKAVYLHRGEVVFAASNLTSDRIGESLVKAGTITVDQLRAAERDFKPGQRFGKSLVEKDFVTSRQLWHGVKYQVEEIVRSLFSYTAGSIYFFAGEVKPDNVVRLSLPTRRLVAEGIQQRDELQKFLALLEDPRVQLVPVEDAGANLQGSDGLLFDALSLEDSFPAICAQLDLEPLATARTVQALRSMGAIRIVRSRQADPALLEVDLLADDDESTRECVAAHMKLISELAEEVVKVEGTEALRRRFERVLEETAHRFPALLAGLHTGPSGTLDPEELTRRALRLADAREQQLRAALGELVSYLEFEVKNHPDIPEPDLILTRLAPLRAEI